jgi:hypothetical protein
MDLMSDGAAYDLLPEVTFGESLANGNKSTSRTDLAMGSFSRATASVTAVVELKSPRADLQVPQQGNNYVSARTGKPMTAIDQALEAMADAHCNWTLASNMRTICLLHSSDAQHALAFDLLEVDGDALDALFYSLGPGGITSRGRNRPRLQALFERTRRLRP